MLICILSERGGEMQNDLRVEKMTEIIKRNSDCVYRLAFSMVKTNQDAEDIRQEVMLRYIRTNPIFENSEHERAWFIRVTTNLCKNLWKTAWRQRVVSMYSLEEDEDSGSRYCKTDCINAGQGKKELTEEEELVVETVKRLPLKYRAVIHLFYYEEMSIEEIAGALNLRPSNVRTRLTRARKMLKDWLKEDV